MALKNFLQYRLIRSIGRGSVGEVFEAEDLTFKRTVALKVIDASLLTAKEERFRFFENARLAARNKHPNLCSVYDVHESDNCSSIAMSLESGQTLERRTQHGQMNIECCAEIGLQILSLIRALRVNNLQFRSLESRNIMITESQDKRMIPKVTEFSFVPLSGGDSLDLGIAGLGALLVRMILGATSEGASCASLLPFCPPELMDVIRRSLDELDPSGQPSPDELEQAFIRCRALPGRFSQLQTVVGDSKHTNEQVVNFLESSGNRYEDVGLIGQGGMGEVRRVYDRYLKRTLAMKILRIDSMSGRDRFLEEAQVMANLQHPSIVPVYDIGELRDGRLYFTMREVKGNTLDNVILDAHRKRTSESGASDATEAVEQWSLHQMITALRRASEGVGYAHDKGVLHRDLKPSNLMVGGFGEVLVIDWGLTRLFAAMRTEFDNGGREPQRNKEDVTRMGTVMGTPMYMSPEQASGDVSKISARSDVYSLGAVLYTILDGSPPYSDADQNVILPVRFGPPRELGERPFGALTGDQIPAELRTICGRAMARDPGQRYANAGEFAEDLALWLEGSQRRERAAKILREAQELKRSIADARAEAVQYETKALQILASIAQFESVEGKKPAWEMQDKARVLNNEADVAEIRFTQLVRGSLTHAPDFRLAHDTLAQHYRDLHAEAEGARDSRAAGQFEVLLRDHDDGRFAAYLEGTGALTLHSIPEGARVLLYRYEEKERRMTPSFLSDLGPTPIGKFPLPMGSYLVKLSAQGRIDVDYPVLIERQQHWDGSRPGTSTPYAIYMPRLAELGTEDRYVPAGWFWSGGDSEAKNSLPAQRLWLDGFVMTRFPVTIGEYVEFLNDLIEQGHEDEAGQHVPPLPAWEEGKAHQDQRELGVVRDPIGRYRLDGPDTKLRWPVTMVNWFSANAYVRWLAAKEQLPWRLPFEMEHEKAARGVDARAFPWGQFLDPTFCVMRYSHSLESRPLKAMVDEYPTDESPYGIRGLAGNTHSWCADLYRSAGPDVVDGIPISPDPAKSKDVGEALRIVRGGSWRDPPELCRTAFRDSPPAVYRDTVLGFRIVRSFP
jgi:eukaryotic-like serine/threonine-protein kinase